LAIKRHSPEETNTNKLLNLGTVEARSRYSGWPALESLY